MLGSGYDSTALRLSELPVRFFELASLLAPGSWLVLDYLHRTAADGTHPDAGVRRAHRAARRRREPWTFGIAPNEVEPWLASVGLRVQDHVSAADVTRRYFPAGAPLAGAAYIGLLTARRTTGGSARS